MWYIHDLAEKLRDPEIRCLWSRSLELHQNFYENWMHPEDVVLALGDAKKLVEKLRKHL